MKKIIIAVSAFFIFTAANTRAQEKSWTASLPGYNMGTTYSYYQPLLINFKRDEIVTFLGFDAVSNHTTVNNPAFIVRYSITKNLQIGLHFNSQLDQWDKTAKQTPPDTMTIVNQRSIASLTSYLPTAVLVYRLPVAKGYFNAGAGVGYYVIRYQANVDTNAVTNDGTTETTTSAVVYSNEVWGGAFGAQTFVEFTYPVFRDLFFLNIRAGYVFCIIPQPFSLSDGASGISYSLPDIDLSGLLATIGFTAEF